jgi:hypothetical protein
LLQIISNFKQRDIKKKEKRVDIIATQSTQATQKATKIKERESLAVCCLMKQEEWGERERGSYGCQGLIRQGWHSGLAGRLGPAGLLQAGLPLKEEVSFPSSIVGLQPLVGNTSSHSVVDCGQVSG